ncbi:hypothetical protein [Nocardiopsis sp. FR6]|uniref:hypothetical protein n=1 Tax=Nocardiopsis sp. FR26 TaxID=2605987 RepID=UPI00351A4064
MPRSVEPAVIAGLGGAVVYDAPHDPLPVGMLLRLVDGDAVAGYLVFGFGTDRRGAGTYAPGGQPPTVGPPGRDDGNLRLDHGLLHRQRRRALDPVGPQR